LGYQTTGINRNDLNERAIHLYKKMRFVIVCVKEKAYYVDGEYIDGYYMTKLI
jgi:ribosomal protein S18 acetylase RimI-like enzyme